MKITIFCLILNLILIVLYIKDGFDFPDLLWALSNFIWTGLCYHYERKYKIS